MKRNLAPPVILPSQAAKIPIVLLDSRFAALAGARPIRGWPTRDPANGRPLAPEMFRMWPTAEVARFSGSGWVRVANSFGGHGSEIARGCFLR
jgi:hypothetical protein